MCLADSYILANVLCVLIFFPEGAKDVWLYDYLLQSRKF